MTGADEDKAAQVDAEWSTLMVAAQAGDRIAYERLLRGCVLLIRRVVHWHGVQPDRVDDVTQETLLIVHRMRQSYDPSRSFSAWLHAIARFRAIDNLRSRRRLARRELSSPLAYKSHSDPDPVKDHLDRRRDQSVWEVLNDLPPGQREAIEALALRRLSPGGATPLIGKIKCALTATMHRVLKNLRGRIDRDPG